LEGKGELYRGVGKCLIVDGKIEYAVSWLEDSCQRQSKLAEDHESRLASQHTLAEAYEANGKVQSAVELLEHIVAIRERVLAEDHPNRLASQHELARAYQANGQVKEAIQLLQHIVVIQERVLAEDHPDRLVSEHALSRLYQETSI
jgi:tetratricopeptide (TPR) repeat protein